ARTAGGASGGHRRARGACARGAARKCRLFYLSAPCGSDRGVRRSPEQVPCVPPTSRIEGINVTGKMVDYTVHMSSIQEKYFNRDEEGKSGTKMRCGVQVGGSPGVRSYRHRRKNAVYFQ